MLLNGRHRLGILAGSGQLPLEVAAEVERRGQGVHIVGIVGEADAAIERFDHTWIEWGQIGALLRAFRRAGCRDVIIIGGVRRPDLRAVRLDAGFFLNLPLILSLRRGGDDSVLRRVIGFFESKDFTVKGVPEVAPDLVARAGVWTTARPGDADRRDVDAGFRLIAALGPFDVGQAVVIADGRVIAIEAAEGTDGMLQRLASARERARAGGQPDAGGVLIKAPKSGQELRVDMPTIGPRTVELAAAAGLRGIAVAAGRVLTAGHDSLCSLADGRGLFLFGADAGEAPSAALHRVASPASGPVVPLVGGGRPRDVQADMERAWSVSRAVAGFEARDGVVVVRRHVLAVGAEETAASVLERVRSLRQWGEQNRRQRRRSGVLATALPPTAALVMRAAEAGLVGVIAGGGGRDGGGSDRGGNRGSNRDRASAWPGPGAGSG